MPNEHNTRYYDLHHTIAHSDNAWDVLKHDVSLEMKMKENNSRAIRRHHLARLKKSRNHYFVVNWWDDKAKRLGIISQYPKKCSCPMCGNPRKWFGYRTISEVRDDFRAVDGMNDLLDND